MLAFGIAAAVPTAVTGPAKWAETEGGDRWVGVLHAGLNVIALGYSARPSSPAAVTATQ